MVFIAAAPFVCLAQTDDKPDPIALRHKQALDQTAALAERFENYTDHRLGAQSLARLGQIVCRFSRPYAETMFHQAMGLVETLPLTGDRDRAIARWEVTSRAATCDPALAKLLSRGGPRFDASYLVKNARQSLDSNFESALIMVTEATREWLSDAGVKDFVDFLNSLRAQDESDIADQLFEARLEWVATQPDFDAGQYAVLGTYVFGPGDDTLINAGLLLPPNTVALTLVDSLPDATTDAIVAYLEQGAELLAIPGANADDVTRARLRYALALALFPQARQYAPDTETQFANVLQQLAGNLHVSPPRLDSVVATDSPSFREDNDLRHAGSQAEEDDLRVQMILRHWPSRETRRMRELAAGINDPALAAKMDKLVSFAEATAPVHPTDHLSACTKTALLWLARGDVGLAVRDTPYADAKLRPVLLLAAARANVNAKVDEREPTYPWKLLADAVEAFNDAEYRDHDRIAALQDDSWQEVVTDDWYEMVNTQVDTWYFPLRALVTVTGLDLRTALPPLAGANIDRVQENLERIRDESVQADALTYVASARLASAFSAIAPPPPPRTKDNPGSETRLQFAYW